MNRRKKRERISKEKEKKTQEKRIDETLLGRRLKPEEIDKMIEKFERKVERGEDTFDDWFEMDVIKGIPGKKRVYVEEYLPASEMHRDPEFVRKAIEKDFELARKAQKQEEQRLESLIKKEGLEFIPKLKGKIIPGQGKMDDKKIIELYTKLGFKLEEIKKALKQ